MERTETGWHCPKCGDDAVGYLLLSGVVCDCAGAHVPAESDLDPTDPREVWEAEPE
jgi:hypothetical protein